MYTTPGFAVLASQGARAYYLIPDAFHPDFRDAVCTGLDWRCLSHTFSTSYNSERLTSDTRTVDPSSEEITNVTKSPCLSMTVRDVGFDAGVLAEVLSKKYDTIAIPEMLRMRVITPVTPGCPCGVPPSPNLLSKSLRR
jgi:hypothetical protein